MRQACLVPLFVLAGCGDDAGPAAEKRSFFLSADEIRWDYAPSGMNLITGAAFDDVANVFMANGPNRIGHVNVKAVFRGYADANFTEPLPVDPEWQHLGTMGPVIRANVGDTVDVTLRNNTQFPRSLHAHGLRYKKDSEGAPYEDGTDQHEDDTIPPGGTVTYHYTVPEDSGPGPDDPSSIAWMYHSHVDEVADVAAGLMGPIIVTRRDQANQDATPIDVDREFVTLFQIMDENKSQYLKENIDTFAGDPGSVDVDDEDFQESNLKHSINGYVYGNLPGLAMQAGERVRWYAMDMGTETDLHTPHWHGETVLVMGQRTDVIALLPATMMVADMTADNPGTWLFHCHVDDHIIAGMLALYTIAP